MIRNPFFPRLSWAIRCHEAGSFPAVPMGTSDSPLGVGHTKFTTAFNITRRSHFDLLPM